MDFVVLEKKDKSFVMIVDFVSQVLICCQLQLDFFGDFVIGEEGVSELCQFKGGVFLKQIWQECMIVGVLCLEDDVCEWIDCGRINMWFFLVFIVDGRIVVGVLGCFFFFVDLNKFDGL